MKISPLFFTLLFFCNSFFMIGQETPSSTHLNVYLDCTFCYQSFLKQELTMLNFVRHPDIAEVQIRVESRRTGAGGNKWTLFFFGHNRFDGHDQELFLLVPLDATQDEARNAFFKIIKTGLLPYFGAFTSMEEVDISYNADWERLQNFWEDDWNNWYFSLGGGGNITFNLDKSETVSSSNSSFQINPKIEVGKVTPNWRTRINYDGDLRSSVIKIDTIVSSNLDFHHRFEGESAFPLGERWSIGGNVGFSFNEKNSNGFFSEEGWSHWVHPKIEYSVFPYKDFLTHNFTFIYALPTFVNKKLGDTHTLGAYFYRLFKWGLVSGTATFRQHIREPQRISFWAVPSISWRFKKGIFLSANARISNSFQTEPQRRSSLNIQFSVGFEKVFGSLYNNVVNPRL